MTFLTAVAGLALLLGAVIAIAAVATAGMVGMANLERAAIHVDQPRRRRRDPR
jgi:Skp family chaperone for outer membrane proteins